MTYNSKENEVKNRKMMQNKDKAKRPCPACGSLKGGDVLYRNRMQLPDSFGISGEYDIVSCGICGCCYANVTASEEAYDNYYRNHNIYGGWQANSSSSYDVDVLIRSIGS